MKAVSLKPKRTITRTFDRSSSFIKALYGAYMMSIDPTLSFTKFYEMYFSKDLLEIDATIFYHRGAKAGVSVAFFYSAIINDKKSFIARSATGLAPEFQGRGLHNRFDLYRKFIRFFFLHPFSPIWVAAYVINPFVFRDLCELIPNVFPAPKRETPAEAQAILDHIAASGGHSAHPLYPLALEVPIQVNFPEKLRDRIFTSANKFVKWSLEKNPEFLNKHGMLVVVGVSSSNVIGTILNFAVAKLRKPAAKSVIIVRQHADHFIGNIANLVRSIFNRRIF